MREWAAGQRPKAGSVLKVVVASKERALVRAFVTALRETTHFVIDGRLARDTDKLGALGTLGHVPLGEHMTLRLISAPADAIYEPLWDVAANGMLGAIILPAGPFGAALEATEAIWARHARAQPALRAPAAARRTRAQPVRLGARDAPAPRGRLLLRAAAAVEPGAARGAAQRLREARSVTHPLDGFPLLSELTADERRALEGYLEPRELDGGSTLYRAGEEADALYFVARGSGHDPRRRPQPGRARSRARCSGALSIVSIGKRECRSSARRRSRLLSLSREAYLRLRDELPPLALRLQEAILRSFSALVRGVLEDSRAA